MERGIYLTFMLFGKLEDEKKGICGWVKTASIWEKNISHYTYEQKVKYCWYSDDEKNFKFVQRKKEFDYLSLFFKKEFKNDIGQFLIPINHILYFKRNINQQIKDKCCEGNFVCPSDVPCEGHKYTDYVEFLFSSIKYAVE